jgi:hypothetical protein
MVPNVNTDLSWLLVGIDILSHRIYYIEIANRRKMNPLETHHLPLLVSCPGFANPKPSPPKYN